MQIPTTSDQNGQDQEVKNLQLDAEKDESYWTRICQLNPEYQGCRLYEI